MGEMATSAQAEPKEQTKGKTLPPAVEKAYAECKEGMTDVQKAYTLQRVAKTLMEILKYEEAAEVLSYAIDNAHIVILFTMRAQCYKAQHMWSEAYFDYCFAIRLERESPSHLIQRALILTKMDKYDMAIEDLTSAIEIDYLPSSYYHRGNVFNEMGLYDHSIEDYTKALKIDAANAMPSVSLQAKVQTQRSLAYFNKGDYERAIADAGVVLGKDPNSLPLRTTLARAYKMNADLPKAEAEMEYVLLMESKEPTYHMEMGDIRYRMADDDKVIEAIHCFDEAIKLLNQQKYAYDEAMKAPVVKGRMGMNRSASMTEFGSSKPSSPGAASSRGGSPRVIDFTPESSRPGTAMTGVSTARPGTAQKRTIFKGPGTLDLDVWRTSTADAHVRRAQAKLFIKYNMEVHARAALHDVKHALLLFPDNEAYRLTEVICHVRLNQDIHAETSLDYILGKNPRNDRAHFHKAFCLQRKGNAKEAVAQLSKIINVMEDEDREERAKELHGIPMYRVYEMRATLLHELMAYKLALVDFGRALSGNSDSPMNFYLRGDCHVRLGNFEQAYNDFMSAEMRGFPDRTALCSARGHVLRMLGDYRQAERDFKESLECIHEAKLLLRKRQEAGQPEGGADADAREAGGSEGTEAEAPAPHPTPGDEVQTGESAAAATAPTTMTTTDGGGGGGAAAAAAAAAGGDDESTVATEHLQPVADYFEEVRLMSLRGLCLIDLSRYPEAISVFRGARSVLRSEEERFEDMAEEHAVGDNAVEGAYNAHCRMEWTVVYHLGLCFHNLRRFEDSCRYLQWCVDEGGLFAPDGAALGCAFFFCGMASNHLSRFVGAERMLDACLETPWTRGEELHLAMAHLSRGKARQGQCDHARALEDFNVALQLRPRDPYILFRRGWAHKGTGLLTEAASDFEDAKQHAPDDPNFAVDYKKIRNMEYMCLELETDFTFKFPSLLPVPTPGAALPPVLQPPEPRFFALDATRREKPQPRRFAPVRKKGWAGSNSAL